MVFTSKEIRWFSKELTQPIIDWFAARDQFFDKTEGRTDLYFRLRGQTNLGIKWREGRMEVKKRTAGPEEGKLTPNCRGYFEEWVKWSFELSKDEGSRVVPDLISETSWLAVEKERLGVVLSYVDGRPVLRGLDTTVTAGCQLEYTRVRIEGRQWFTFGLEWFGEEIVPLPEDLMNEILGAGEYSRRESMGYAEFLSGNNWGNG